MRSHLEAAGPYPSPAAKQPLSANGAELWRGSWVIFRKHMLKFRHNSMEIGGTLGWPLLWIGMFGVGMQYVVNPALLGTASYLAYITPGIIALTALGGAVNSGMTLLEEKIKGILKEYFVAPIPRLSILLASTGSGLVKTLLQSAIILVVALLFGVRLANHGLGILAAACFLLLYVMAFVGFSIGIAARSQSISGYHMLVFALNLPLLFLSNALYPLATMPTWMAALAYVNPTTYVVDALRRTLFGAGTLPLWLCAAVLSFYAVLGVWYGVKSFRKILEPTS